MTLAPRPGLRARADNRGRYRISGASDEAQGDRIHAVAQPCRLRTIVEDMTEMRVATAARDRGAHHDRNALVHALDDVQRRNRLPETWPAGAGLELGARIEQ